jgi:hypothetical protein
MHSGPPRREPSDPVSAQKPSKDDSEIDVIPQRFPSRAETDETGDAMTDPAPKKAPPGRTMLMFILMAFVVVGVIAATLSPYAGIAVLVVALVLGGLAFRRLHPSGTGMGILSTNCESCGSSLRSLAGLPTRKCPTCGHVQSWAK